MSIRSDQGLPRSKQFPRILLAEFVQWSEPRMAQSGKAATKLNRGGGKERRNNPGKGAEREPNVDDRKIWIL